MSSSSTECVDVRESVPSIYDRDAAAHPPNIYIYTHTHAVHAGFDSNSKSGTGPRGGRHRERGRGADLLVDVLLEVGRVERQAHGVHAVVDVVDSSGNGLPPKASAAPRPLQDAG